MNSRFTQHGHRVRQLLVRPSPQQYLSMLSVAVQSVGVLAALLVIPAFMWGAWGGGVHAWVVSALLALLANKKQKQKPGGETSQSVRSWPLVAALALTTILAAILSVDSPLLFYSLGSLGLIGFDWLFGWRRAMLLAAGFSALYLGLQQWAGAGAIEAHVWILTAFFVAFHINWLGGRSMLAWTGGVLQEEQRLSRDTRRVMLNRVSILQVMAEEFAGPYSNLKMLLQTPSLGPQARRDAHRSIGEFLRLVDDMSRTAGVGSVPALQLEPLELTELIYEVERKLRPLFRERQIEFDLAPIRLTGAHYCVDLYRLRALLMAVPQAAALAAEPGSRFYLGFKVGRASDSVHYLNILLRASDVPVTLPEARQTLVPGVNPDSLNPIFAATGFLDVISWIEALQAQASFDETEDGALELRVNVPLSIASTT